jgi:chromosomal replication initiation ATPase DnaA
MSQLPLNILPRLAYTPENFLLHGGIQKLYMETVSTACNGDAFSVAYIVGSPRSGKTHLGIMLAAALSSRRIYPRLVEGEALAKFIEDQELQCPPNGRCHAAIIDNAERYFQTIEPGQSGPFVNFVERLRKESGALIFLSSQELAALPCDEHVTSRLIPGSGLHIAPPDTEDLKELIAKMARQRGLSLSERKVQFLVVRLGRSVSSIEDYLDRLTHLSTTLSQSIKFPLLSDAI